MVKFRDATFSVPLTGLQLLDLTVLAYEAAKKNDYPADIAEKMKKRYGDMADLLNNIMVEWTEENVKF